MSYTKSPHTFEQLPTHNSFILTHLKKSKYRKFPVGSLALEVLSSLSAASSFQSLLYRARLVNIRSLQSGFSYGEVDSSATPFINYLVFTFALSSDSEEFPDDPDITTVSTRCNVYGQGTDKKFVAIGVDAMSCARLGLKALRERELRYLFLTCGHIFRVAFRHRQPLHLTSEELQDSKVQVDTTQLSSLPLTIALSQPYLEWPYYRSIWTISPNLIAQELISPSVVEAWLRDPEDKLVDFLDAGSSLIWATSENLETGLNSVTSVLENSMKNFLLTVSSSDVPENVSTEDLLAPCLLHTLITTGKRGLPESKAAFDVYYTMLKACTIPNEILQELFTPIEQVVNSMLNADTEFMLKLLDQNLLTNLD